MAFNVVLKAEKEHYSLFLSIRTCICLIYLLTDVGTNISAAKADLEAGETLDPNVVREITQGLKSSGVSLIQ